MGTHASVHTTYVCARTKEEGESLFIQTAFTSCAEVGYLLSWPSLEAFDALPVISARIGLYWGGAINFLGHLYTESAIGIQWIGMTSFCISATDV